MNLDRIAAIPDLSLTEALALVDQHFDATAIVQRSIDLRGVEEYYRQSDRGYRLFHSREGALHIALGSDGHHDTHGFERQAELFRGQLDEIDGHHAVEFGCGMGYNVRWLAEHCPDRTLLGIDLTESHIRHCVKQSAQLPNAQFVVANYEELSYPADSFDAVLAVETLCQTAGQEQALREAHRVLRPGGRLVVIDCFRRVPLESLDHELRQAALLVEKTAAVDRFAVADEWLKLATSVGLREVETRDLSSETRENLARLHSLARRFFKMPVAMRAMAKAFPPMLRENSICGLLMPFTVGLGAHAYQMMVVEK